MESKWYLFPGQTIENTKISDRAHALHIKSEAWHDITRHLDRKKLQQEAIDKEKARKEALREGSREMTKNWDNSLENIHLRKEAERRERQLQQKGEDQLELFYQLRAEQEVVRQQYIEKVKRDAYIDSGRSKPLNSALFLSEAIYEREKHIEFRNKVRQHEREMKEKQDQDILDLDAKHRQEDADAKQNRRDDERKLANEIMEQVKKNETKRAAELKAHIERETQDRINADNEERLLKEFALHEKIRKQRESNQEKKTAIALEKKRKESLRKEEEEMERATQFYKEAKERIDCLLKSKWKEMQEEAVNRRDAIAQRVAAVVESKDAEEEAKIAAAVAEQRAKEQARADAKEALRRQEVADKIDGRKKYLERKEQEEHIEHEMKRWELLNTCKTLETTREFDEKHRREHCEKMKAYQREILQQRDDDIERKKEEKRIDDLLSHVSYDQADKLFLDYGNEILEQAKTNNRATYPIEKAIADYKKTYNLVSQNKHCKHKNCQQY